MAEPVLHPRRATIFILIVVFFDMAGLGLISLPLHVAEPDALQLRILIFKAEIDMPGTGAGKISP